VSLSNMMIVENQARGPGAGVCVDEGRVAFIHTTLADNAGGDGSAVHVMCAAGKCASAAFTNTIISGHSIGVTTTAGSAVTLEHTLWHGNATDAGGSGAINSSHDVHGDPAYIGGGDYHITAASAARDAGLNAGVTIDIDGDARPTGAGYDIGADEWQETGNIKLYLPLFLKGKR
jgi:hypothetical protein